MTHERRLSDEFWDLRDDAHDAPARWSGVTAEEIFQRLADKVEDAEGAGEPLHLSTTLKEWRTQVTGIEPPSFD